MTSIGFDLTARCNLNCRHCYVNLPAGHLYARKNELTREKINAIFDEAVTMGTMWVLLTGGEPLLRRDFTDIYLDLRRKGLLVSLFTNATLVTPEIAMFLAKYPPRELEVTVYGTTRETYERVTRLPGSYKRFLYGLSLLKEHSVKLTLKAMAIRSTLDEMQAIGDFCNEWGDGKYRFDPTLHLRYDGDHKRNSEIIAERLTPDEVITLEQQYPERIEAYRKLCLPEDDTLTSASGDTLVFKCGVGRTSADISWDGMLRPCSALTHPDYTYNLHTGTLRDGWENHIPKLFRVHSDRKEFLDSCAKCRLFNLCFWCPAHAYLEHGQLDQQVDWFCSIAHKREDIAKQTPKFD